MSDAAPLDPAMVEAGARRLHCLICDDAILGCCSHPLSKVDVLRSRTVLSAALSVGGFHRDDDCPNAEMHRANAALNAVVADGYHAERDALRVRVEEQETAIEALRNFCGIVEYATDLALRSDCSPTDMRAHVVTASWAARSALASDEESVRARVSVPPKDES